MLEDVIRAQLAAEGRGHHDDLDAYVAERLDNMSASELLSILSYSIDWKPILEGHI